MSGYYPFPSLTDEQLLLVHGRHSSNLSFNELYRRYYPCILRHCHRFAQQDADAEDLAQDVFMKIMERFCRFQGQSKLSTWIYAITHNHCIDWVRKRNCHEKYRASMKEVLLEPATEEVFHDEEHRYERLLGELSKFPEADREMLCLKYQSDMSIKELQTLFDLSESAVKMRLKRSKERLAKCCAV